MELKESVNVKKEQIISICILIVTLVIIEANRFIAPLSDWVIRMDGIIMLAGLFAISFSTVKCIRERSKKIEDICTSGHGEV